MRVWQNGSPEPGEWYLDDYFPEVRGAILLVAHRAEVTFGDVIIQPLGTVASADPPPLRRLAVLPNAPNPFGAGTTIQFHVAESADVVVDVFAVRGRRVFSRTVAADGPGEIQFDAVDTYGRQLPSGVYFYRVHTPTDVVTRKMVLSR